MKYLTITIFTSFTFFIIEAWIIAPGKFGIFITFLCMGLLYVYYLATKGEKQQ